MDMYSILTILYMKAKLCLRRIEVLSHGLVTFELILGLIAVNIVDVEGFAKS
jgi:hypothetical protein